jgi:hypothetical protein
MSLELRRFGVLSMLPACLSTPRRALWPSWLQVKISRKVSTKVIRDASGSTRVPTAPSKQLPVRLATREQTASATLQTTPRPARRAPAMPSAQASPRASPSGKDFATAESDTAKRGQKGEPGDCLVGVQLTSISLLRGFSHLSEPAESEHDYYETLYDEKGMGITRDDRAKGDSRSSRRTVAARPTLQAARRHTELDEAYEDTYGEVRLHPICTHTRVSAAHRLLLLHVAGMGSYGDSNLDPKCAEALYHSGTPLLRMKL